MVISFSSDTAFKQLKEEGVVVSFRSEENVRKKLGEDWCNRGRGEKKKFDVYIKLLEQGVEPTRNVLEDYLALSGFPYVVNWQDKIMEMNGRELPDEGNLYLVIKVGSADDLPSLSSNFESVASYLHDLWMKWSKHIADEEDISPERLHRWSRDCWMPYEELSEDMKDKDRKYVKELLERVRS